MSREMAARARASAVVPARARWLTAEVIAGIVGAVTFLAYLPGLGRSLDYDAAETVGYFIKPGPPWIALQRQAVFNNHPAFSFLEQLVKELTGRTDAATLRVLPIVFGAAAVAVLTWHCARRFGALAGVVAGVVTAANPTFQSLSREVRGYSLLTLCAVVTTVLVIDEVTGTPRSTRREVVYAVAAGIGIATHLFMVPVVLVHVAVIVATGRLDERWRLRLLGAAVIASVAYAGMVGAMIDASAKHDRLFQPGLPVDIATMALGGGVAAIVLLPVAAAGLARLLRHRSGRVAIIAGVGAFALLWLVQQSSALTERFFVWVVPAAAYLVALAVRRWPRTALVAVAAVVAMTATYAGSYVDDPTSYRAVAPLIQAVDRAGAQTCVVDVGVPAITGYADEGRDFRAVTDPGQLDGCDVVVVAAWWNVTDAYFASDRRIIAAATARYPVQTVVPSHDPILVLSTRPLASWTG